jgi:hypothetical protein
MDSLNTRKLELEILRSKSLPPEKRYLVEQEWKSLISGERGEKNTAYLLDFFLDDKKNWMLIHDLRLEYNGKIAQIDHLIITRALDFFVLETKAYGDTLQILDDGSFLASYGKKKFAVPSPIEQNKRHVYILDKVIKNLLPTRLGFTLEPNIESYVLIDAKTHLKRSKKFDSSSVVKAEQFLSLLDKKYEQLGVGEVLKKASKLISQKSVLELSRKIAKLHAPSLINYKEKFEITDKHLQDTPTCFSCGKDVTQKNIEFCNSYPDRFQNKAYCFQCQKEVTG